MEQTARQDLSLREWLRLVFAAYWRIIRVSPPELTEIVMGLQALWWGGGLLLPADALGTAGLLTRDNEVVVGACFIVASLYKFAAVSLDAIAPRTRYHKAVRQSAALLLLVCWSVVTYHFWSRNPWGTGALNYSYLMLIQGFLFARQVARREP